MRSYRHLIALSVCLIIIGLLFAFYDNTDNSLRNWKIKEIDIVFLVPPSPKLRRNLEVELDTLHTMDFDEKDRYRCLSAENTTGSVKEQFHSFLEGDCAPIIMIPGLEGTKLMVQIDCEILQEKNPDIMDACGWTTCNKWNLFESKPKDEYLLFVPKLRSPMSMISLRDNECFGLMMGFDYNSSEKLLYNKYRNIEGLKVTWYGNTPETYYQADGGFSAVEDMLPSPIQTKSSKQFRGLADNFEKMGYQKGLTLFAIPYDFRLTHMANNVSYILERTIQYAFELTGKKAVIMAHSLGNVNTLPVLNRMSQHQKDKMIAAYIALMPSLGGVSAPIRTQIGGDTDLLYKDFIGLQVSNQRRVMSSFSSLFELLPGDAYFRFEDEPWMKELIQRVEAEDRYNISTTEGARYWNDTQSIPLPWFPTPSHSCFGDFRGRPGECRTLITDMKKQPVAIIEGEKFYANRQDIYRLIRNHYTFSDSGFAEEMYNDSLTQGIQNFENPGVNVFYVYGSHLPTEIANEWYYDPSKVAKDNEFAFPNRTYNRYGDERIEVSLGLPIAFKWAWENRNNVSNAKAIKIIEYCSVHKTITDSWDAYEKSDMGNRTETEYLGLNCECWQDGILEDKDCDHSGILQDKYLFGLVKNVALTKQKSLNSTSASRLNSSELLELIDSLPHLRRPREDVNVSEWLVMK